MGQWLTPDAYPDRIGVALHIPDSSEARQVLSGALLLLAESYNWEEFGDLTPAQTAAVWADVLIDFQAKRGLVMPIGAILYLAGGDLPGHCLACDGALYDPEEYPLLFAAIGYAYDSGENSTFGVPDLRGMVALGIGAGNFGGDYALGDTGGSIEESISPEQLAGHAHSVHQHGTPASVGAGAISVSTPSGTPTTTGGAGEDYPISRMQPYIALNPVIVSD